MARLQTRPEVREVLLQRELLLFEAVQSPMAYFMPFFMALLGGVVLFPQFWDGMGAVLSENTRTYLPLGKHVFSEMGFGVVMIAGGLGVIFNRQRASRTGFHFLTNFRVVERNKTWRRDDLQFIMLHHVKVVRVKAGIISRLLGMGRIILEDDNGLEHIEIANVASPKQFKDAILKAANRFAENAARVEKDGYLIQVQSEKSAREQRRRKREQEQKRRRKEQERLREQKRRLDEQEQKKRQEEEDWARRNDDSAY